VQRTALRVLSAIQLTRLTMAFGAVSDVWFVILLTKARRRPDGTDAADIAIHDMPLALALFVGAIVAVGLFAYGASLNDVLDARHDSAFSPERPIPAGRIRVGQAIVMTVGALLVAVLGGHALGSWALQLTLLTALGILFFNAAGKFIPAVGIVTVGLIHAVHMLIPNALLDFTWPVWFVMSHAMCVAAGAYIFEGKRPRITRPAVGVIVAGWAFWSGLGLALRLVAVFAAVFAFRHKPMRAAYLWALWGLIAATVLVLPFARSPRWRSPDRGQGLVLEQLARQTPLYDILTVQPSVDVREVEKKDFRLAMRLGSSNHYKVGDIIGRHIIETGLEAGLSREVMAKLFEEIKDQADEAITRTADALPDGFPMTILDSIAAAMTERLRRLVDGA